MQKVGVREAREQISRLLDAVEAGEEVIISTPRQTHGPGSPGLARQLRKATTEDTENDTENTEENQTLTCSFSPQRPTIKKSHHSQGLIWLFVFSS